MENQEVEKKMMSIVAEDGSIIIGAIIGYIGNENVVTIPDTLNASVGSETKIIKIILRA